MRETHEIKTKQVHEKHQGRPSSVWTKLTNEVVVSGRGCWLSTASGRNLLDFTSGIGVTNTGHSHPTVVRAIANQAQTLLFSQVNCAQHNRLFELCEALAPLMPGQGLDRFFFAQSGAEAVEGAVKLARQVTGRPNLVVFSGSFHGRTHQTMAMTTSKAIYRRGYPNLPGGVLVAPFPYAFASGRNEVDEVAWALDALDQVLATQTAPEDTAAIFVEPVLGEGGYIPAPPSWLRGLRERCDQHGILLVVDEIQSGFCRTGDWFAINQSGVNPDILVMAKGLASGVPISGIAYQGRFDTSWIPGSHGGTYGASPLGCAAALATIRVMEEEKLYSNARVMGQHLQSGLEELMISWDLQGDIRGRGLMVGLELMDGPKPAYGLVHEITKAALEEDLLLLTCGTRKNVIRWVPPLVVSLEEIDQGLARFERALSQVLGHKRVGSHVAT